MKFFLTIICLAVPFCTNAQGFNKQKLDAYFQLLSENDKANISLALSKSDQIVYQNQVGFLSEKRERKINAETLFRIGSITKTFTSVIIFQLIEEGEVMLNSKLFAYFPKVENAEKITIAHLLSHQSGIHNFTDAPAYVGYMTQEKTSQELLAIIENQPSDFEPGSQTSYSNSSYVLLGLIIEKLTKQTYEQNLKSRIIEKINLKHTFLGDKIETEKNEAASMMFQGEWIRFPMESNMSIPFSAGAIVSTPADLNHFMYALFNGKLVSDSSLREMKNIQNGMGHGLFSVPFGKRQGLGHGGRIDNFDSGSYYFAADDMNVTLFSSGTTLVFNDMLIAILSIYFDVLYDLPDFKSEAIEIPADELVKYKGEFTSDTLPMDITIAINGDALTAQATGQGAFPLEPFSKREFRFDTAGIVLLFAEIDGAVDYSTFTLKQGGQQFHFKRK